MSHTLDELMRGLARPLRQVHDLRDVLPRGRRDAALPRAEVRRPPGRALSRSGGPSPDVSLDYCSSCGICTQVCPQGVKIAEINSQARARLKEDTGVPLRDRLIVAADAVRAARRAGGADRQLDDGQPGGAGPHREDASASTARRPCRSWAGRPYHAVARRQGRRRKPDPAAAARTVVYFHGCGADYYEPGVARMAVEVLEHNGFQVDRAQAGLLRAAAPEQRPLRRRPRLRAPARRPPGALRARRARHRRDLDELRPDAQARGAGDPRRRGRRPARGRRAPLRHLRVPGDAPRARRARHRLHAARRWRSPTTPPASSGGTAWAPRRWS